VNCLRVEGSLPNLDDEVSDPPAEPRSGIASADFGGLGRAGPIQFRLKFLNRHGLPTSPYDHPINRLGAL
jgi:hypothetical protein